MTLPRLALLLLLALPAAAAEPPVAAKKPHAVELHGDTRVDDYFWMKDKTNPEVVAHLNAENAYTAAAMASTEELQATLYKEFLGRIKQTDLDVPYRDGGHWYYARTEEGKQYGIFARKTGTLDAPEELLLDVNALAAGKKYMSARPADRSDDGNLLAFISDETGFREYFVSVKELRTGKLVEDRFAKSSDATFCADGTTLFYVTEDAAKRAHKLWRHTLGTPKSADAMLYEEKDELYRLSVGRTRDKKYLVRASQSSTTSEMWFLPADQPNGTWSCLRPREVGTEYVADHRDGLWYVRTNRDGATNFKLMTCPVNDVANWKAYRPYDAKVHVTGLTLFRDFAIVSEREAGLPHLRVIPTAGEAYRIRFPEPVYSASLGRNPEFDAASVHMSYTSMVTPASVYDFDLKTKERKLLKRQEIPSGYDPAQYESERIEATAPDGTKVPMSLVYRKGLKRDGRAPCLLYGYGSYGATLPVGFNTARLSLLDRGVVYAQAHVRGGSDMGRGWYDDGKMLKKKNTFSDFAACADHLVNSKYCDRAKLALQGGSAGGLLVGATLNLRPNLCGIAVLQVPFVDVVNTMLDESVPLTVQEFLEWGNPKKREEYEYMKSYCPYSNLKKGDYPAILVTTSLNDSQVLFHEPAKYVAKLRPLKVDARPLLFKCNMDAGHGGASGRYDNLKEQAFIYAFVLAQMNP